MNLHNDFLEHSPISYVNFAGFRAHTAQLSQEGWAVSAYQGVNESRYERILQIALKHDCGLSLMSNGILFESLGDLVSGSIVGSRDRFMGHKRKQIEFQIQGVCLNGQSRFMRAPKPIEIDVMMSKEFTPVDCMPSIQEVNLHDINFDDFCLFKPLNDSANIYIPQERIPEAMEIILKHQEPEQAAIRYRRRKEKLREGVVDCGRTSKDTIKAQLIAI